MQANKTKYSVCRVRDNNGKIIGYLTQSMIDRGRDIQLDLLGYKIESI